MGSSEEPGPAGLPPLSGNSGDARYSKKLIGVIKNAAAEDEERATGCPWQAYITHRGKRLYLGDFSTQQEAAEQYDRASILRDPFDTALNFPIDQYEEWVCEVKSMDIFERDRCIRAMGSYISSNRNAGVDADRLSRQGESEGEGLWLTSKEWEVRKAYSFGRPLILA